MVISDKSINKSIKGIKGKIVLNLDNHFKFHVENLKKDSYKNMEYVGETIEKMAKVLLENYNFNIKYRNFCAYLMREIMRNVVEHSEAENFNLSLYSNEFGDFGFEVIDNGIGIKKSLNSNPMYSVKDNKTALAFAVRPGITKSWKKDPLRDDVWQNSGFGLYMVSNIVNDIGGKFELESGNSKIVIKNGMKEYQNGKIKGTKILVLFNVKEKIDTIGIVKAISIKGNEYLKSSESFSEYATIKTASKASTLIN
ncbi:sensor histidine kinase [Clostridium botulinum]|uniref:ATP-binding protein n=1 Tax=Clostridium botulinum TaxID=1491 RepID=UPI000774BC9E|nr:ATP-binding protein [Clostridium botulinum]MBY7025231.1 ATP-binding protein [Clostridium botulinum]NFE85456.1 sensor histidine kinase [Clostridium botulinum]NFG36824.1 sensor histidine kinase [Clostridium botulinum]NFN27378.1 sensor histidine kinase [Clostridium botulinum]NFN46611.1 sensor histidine kinase [Clostridium botulinum]